MEQKKGGKLVSSIESLDFSVTSKEDVEITVNDLAGWQLDKASPKVLHNLTVFVRPVFIIGENLSP